mmetsp:Transcript_478/g.1467  ORF Transcript_478/g.1467 Transcript_478/m.1467 type:complete len:241 (-) Transcript_478:2028-2750(-)
MYHYVSLCLHSSACVFNSLPIEPRRGSPELLACGARGTADDAPESFILRIASSARFLYVNSLKESSVSSVFMDICRVSSRPSSLNELLSSSASSSGGAFASPPTFFDRPKGELGTKYDVSTLLSGLGTNTLSALLSYTVSHSMLANHGCALTSSAPPADPNLASTSCVSSALTKFFDSSLNSSLFTGHCTSHPMMFEKIASGVGALNGGAPMSISYAMTPSAHQSTASPHGSHNNTSGAR